MTLLSIFSYILLLLISSGILTTILVSFIYIIYTTFYKNDDNLENNTNDTIKLKDKESSIKKINNNKNKTDSIKENKIINSPKETTKLKNIENKLSKEKSPAKTKKDITTKNETKSLPTETTKKEVVLKKRQIKTSTNNKIANKTPKPIQNRVSLSNEKYYIEYLNENEFRKKERAIKKYNMLAYKKLLFDYYPSLREGIFQGTLVSSNEKDKTEKYELTLPTDKTFVKVHGNITLHYTVYLEQKTIILETLTPEDILTEGSQKELTTYKGVMISKSHADKEMFKINLLNMLDK